MKHQMGMLELISLGELGMLELKILVLDSLSFHLGIAYLA